MADAAELAVLLGREHLPPAFERWRVTLRPGEERRATGAEWAGAVVLVERGALAVECQAGGSRTFDAGDLLALGLLPLRSLRNSGPDELILLAIKRIETEVVMFRAKRAFSSYSVSDLDAAQRFYGETLGLEVSAEPGMGLLTFRLAGGGELILYAKENHVAATFTVLNFVVEEIEGAVDDLLGRGVRFERYEGFEQDEKGISRPPSPDYGPPIAWFTDPAGNILAVLEAA